MTMTTTKGTLPLRLTPYAWAKLLRLRDLGDTEVGGFGVSAADDLLLIEDICLIRQCSTEVTVKFDDEAVADYFDRQVDRGLFPERFARIWIHTHPGSSPHPSCTDEETFARCFGSADWAVMFILARGGQTYARLRLSAGPGGALVLPVEIDFHQPFAAADWAAWDAEYSQAVVKEVIGPQIQRRRPRFNRAATEDRHDSRPDEWWYHSLWSERSPIAGPFDDELLPNPFPETEDECFGPPF